MSKIEVVRADPKLRRTALALVLSAIVIGAVAIGWFVPWLTAALKQAQTGGTLAVPLACYLFLLAIAALAFGVIGFGVYGARFGAKVLQTGQYPPPGTRVIRDTRIQRGPVAVFTGRGQFLLGLTFIACGIALLAAVAWGFMLLNR